MTSTSISPGDQQTYKSVFTEPVWYGIQFTLDGREPRDNAGTTRFHPVPPDSETGRLMTGGVGESGDFTWSISSTENTGSFES